jgi:hypothetical protein
VTIKVLSTAYASDWSLITQSEYAGSIGGTGDVFGTGGNEDITVLDEAGTVVFDPSFGSGDIVRLAGDAADWKITLSGSNAVLTDGDTMVILPARPDAIPVLFADGVRGLTINGTDLEIGGQVVTEDFAAITAAPDGTPLPGGTDPETGADLIFNPGGEAVVAGQVDVFGTAASEMLTVLSGKVNLDPSFNGSSGNVDLIAFDDGPGDFDALLEGSNVVLTGNDTMATIPIGPAPGTNLGFDGTAATLSLDPGTSLVTIGTQEITDTATPLSFA